MTPTPEVQERLRRYLLGQVTEEAREEIEKDLLASDEIFQELQVIEDEIVDAYLKGGLNETDRSGFEKHFLTTPERSEKLSFGRAFNRHLSAQRAAPALNAKPLARRRPFFSSPLAIATFAVLILGIAFGAWRIFIYESDVDKGLRALNAAYREQRPLESRISALSYAPFSATRSPNDPGHFDQVLRTQAEAMLSNALNERAEAKTHHALGQVFLAKREFDQAIQQFDDAIKAGSKNPKLYSDLGAAWLEKGKIDLEDNRVQDFARSLGYLNQALEANGNSLEALFNRALCRQYLILWDDARNDWLEYLRQDPNSKWASEARQNLKLLDDRRKQTSQGKDEIFQSFLKYFESRNDEAAWRIISSYHDRTGNIVVERLLDAYLEASTKRDHISAQTQLARLSYVASLEEKVGERFFSDVVHFYKGTTSKQQAAIVSARALLRSAHGGWGQAKVEESLSAFVKAKGLFDEAGDSAEAALTEYWISFCYYRKHDEKLSLSRLEPLISLCQRLGYKYLQVRTVYLLSIVHFNLNEHSRAVEFANRSLALAEETGDVVGIINALNSLVEYSRYLGNTERALTYIAKSLPLISSISMDPIQGIRVYGFQATALASAGYYAAAADYEKQALLLALTIGNVSTIAYSYTFLATINGRLENYEVGIRNAQLAYDVAAARSNEAADRELMAYATLQMGSLYRQQGNLQAAVQSYDRSIELFEALKQPTNLYQAHRGKAQCFVALGDHFRARSEIATALRLVEEYRDKIFEVTDRESFFKGEQSLYDIAIDFQYSKMHDELESFRLSEMSRARSLLDLIHAEPRVSQNANQLDLIFSLTTSPLPVSEITRRLPAASQILQYAVLKGKLVIWVVSNQKISSVSHEIEQEQLNEKVTAFLKLLSSPSSDDAETEKLARELFNILIKPAEQFLDHDKVICIVPDKSLNYLPFSALVSPSGRYLMEDYLLISSPGSSVFIASSKNARDKEGPKSESLLSVGNPDFDRSAFPSLLDLPSASREAKDVAAYYDSPRTLTAADATVNRVREGMTKADVIHLAAHSSLDERFPLRSKLVLAKRGADSGDNSTLKAFEIYRLKLERPRLVVLSACQTGAEHYYDGEGMISLARPFIVAGVPMVVASLWPVDSEATYDLMVKFHRNRRLKTLPTIKALQQAQIEMLRTPDGHYSKPYYWAPFIVIGGYAQY